MYHLERSRFEIADNKFGGDLHNTQSVLIDAAVFSMSMKNMKNILIKILMKNTGQHS